MKKRLLGVILASVLTVSMVTPVFADQEQDIRNARSQAYSSLSATNSNLAELNKKQKAIQAQVDKLNQDIVDLMVQIDQAENDIKTTESQISETENKIADTQKKLDAAQKDADEQYAAMKKRIQYTYENGGDSGWLTAVLSSKDFASFINTADYATELSETDRDAFNKLVDAVNKVKTLKKSLEDQKKSLEDQKANLENMKAQLDAQNEDLKKQKAEREAAGAENANQIVKAQQQAKEISELISQQTAAINQIEAQKIAAAKKAAEEAAAEKAAQQAASNKSSNRETAFVGASLSSSERAASSGSSRKVAAAAKVSNSEATVIASQQAEAARKEVIRRGGSSSQAAEAAAQVKAAVKSAASSGASKSSIVEYANKYVGGKYSWGGDSLTGGIDCSHFVTQVLTNTGNYSGGYRTSGEWASAGKSVSSLSEAKAGDVIVYSGHVSIYDGNGGQIEAQSSKAGITNNRKVNSDKIVAIRRVSE